jgi:hypothetical protein
VSVDLGALFAQHKRTLAFAGAAAVGGLALMQARGRDSSGGDASGVVMPSIDRASTGGGPTAAWPIAGGFAPYDSGGSDVYNALQPQIEYLQRLAEKQAEEQGGAIPVAAPPKAVNPAAGIKAGFYKMAGTPNVYRISGGRIDYLTPKQLRAMLPKGTKVGALSPDAPVFANGAHWLDKSKQRTAPQPNTAK